MPNGKPGDHPYTDIVLHDAEILTETIREIVREVDDYGETGAKDRAGSVLLPSLRDASEEEVERLEHELRSLRAAIRQAQHHAAESPLEACLDDEASIYDESRRQRVREIADGLREQVDNTHHAIRVFSAFLWGVGWDPDSLQQLDSKLDEFSQDHSIWDK